MAVFTTYYYVDMTESQQPNDTDTIPNKTTIQSASHIQVVSIDTVKNIIANMYGSFHYNSQNILTDGTLTGIDGYGYGSKFFEISAMNLNLQNINGYPIFFKNFLLGNDTVNGSFQNDRLNGFSGNDILYGNGGNDNLLGDTGNDSLNGGLGKDTLTGGTGSDRFIFKAINETGITLATADSITDFKSIETDKIDISAIDANNATSLNDSFKFIGALSFSNSNATAQLRFDSINHILYGSTDVDNSAEFAIQMTGINSLVVTNLIL